MFFQVNISPVHKATAKGNRNEKKESEKATVLSLAPFTPNPKLFFEDIKVGTEAIRELIIENPSKQDVELYLTRVPSEDKNVKFSWHHAIIQAENKVVLSITWAPIAPGSWRENISLEDGKRFKKDIPIVFKSLEIKNKKNYKNKTKPPTFLSKKVKSPVKLPKSPKINQKSRQPAPLFTKPMPSTIPQIVLTPPPCTTKNSFLDYENCVSSSFSFNNTNLSVGGNRNRANVLSPLSNMYLQNIENVRDTYTIKDKIFGRGKENIFDDSLNTPPSSPNPFRPCVCSSEEKSYIINNDFRGTIKTSLFSAEKTDTNTLNFSSRTYTKNSFTSENFFKVNGGNLSSETYMKDLSIASTKILSPSAVTTDFRKLQFYSSRETELDVKESASTNNKRALEQDSLSSFDSRFVFHSSIDSCSQEKKRKFDVEDETVNLFRSNYKPLATSKKANLRIDNNGSYFQHSISNKTVVYHDPFVLAATNSLDPFLAIDLKYAPRWLEEQEERFKKWLNALLTPPSDLSSDAVHPDDVAKIWRNCKKSEVSAAPTKEAVCNKYHTTSRLMGLRAAAAALLQSPEIKAVLRKTMASVDSGKLSVRSDRDVHLDLGIQSAVMSLLLSYNPLWLRIGLEAVYDTIIPLKSNSDIMGLSHFLLARFFKDPFLLDRHKTTLSNKYSLDIKKFILKKYLALVYFLDRAKCRKLIKHDPCLFCKNAPVKESREMLLRFSKEVIHAVGDVTKYLRHVGYSVTYRQTFIDEFDYAVNNLGTDLRDGVRLAKIAEVILLEQDLTGGLRVPAISRLQKIHNVEVAFAALKKAGFEIGSGIDPRDVVNGHREKTLSLLWQILYRFEAPLLKKSATTVQCWWRSLRVVVKRKAIARRRQTRSLAALKIQKWYRRLRFSAKLERFLPALKICLQWRKRERAAVKIQSCFKMWMERRKFNRIKASVVLIQCYSRKYLQNQLELKRQRAAIVIQNFCRGLVVRRNYLRLKSAVVTVQQRYIAKREMVRHSARYKAIKAATLCIQQRSRAYFLMKRQRREFLDAKRAAVRIQSWYRLKRHEKFVRAATTIQRKFRAWQEMKIQRQRFLRLRSGVVYVQRRFRANRTTKAVRNEYTNLRISAIKIQLWFKSSLVARRGREEFLRLKSCAITVQRRFRALRLMKRELGLYQTQRRAALCVQRRFRAKRSTEKARSDYLTLRSKVIFLQRQIRAFLLMKKERDAFERTKRAVKTIQIWYRYHRLKKLRTKAAVTIQRYYRLYRKAKQERNRFVLLRKYTIFIQSKVIAKRERSNYLKLLNAVLIIQRRFRAVQKRKYEQLRYKTLRKHVTLMQARFRAKRLMLNQRDRYLSLKNSAIIIQRRFRARRLGRHCRGEFATLKRCTVLVQRRFRANLARNLHRENYVRLKNSVVFIQTAFRANRLMRTEYWRYENLKRHVVLVQRKFRAKLQRNAYRKLRDAAVAIQRRFRANRDMKSEKERYDAVRTAILSVQRRFRANLAMKAARRDYLLLRKYVVLVQRKYRAKRLMEDRRNEYVRVRESARKIQLWYRAFKLGEAVRFEYIRLRTCVVMLQRRCRAKRAMKIAREEYLALKSAVILVQRCFRNKKLRVLQKQEVLIRQQFYSVCRFMTEERRRFLEQRNAAIWIQRRYRALSQMKAERDAYLNIRKIVVSLQIRFRSNRIIKTHRQRYENLRTSSILIQRKFRATMQMKRDRLSYQNFRDNVIRIQRLFRARRAMLLARNNYTALKTHALMIQNRFRALLAMRRQRTRYLALKRATMILQRTYRARKERRAFLQLKSAAVFVQRRFRAKQLMAIQRARYLSVKRSALVIQTRFRALQDMRKERDDYIRLKSCAIVIQNRFRATLKMRLERLYYTTLKTVVLKMELRYIAQRCMRREYEHFRKLKKAAIVIQRRYRALRSMREERDRLISLRRAAIVLQRCYRAHREVVLRKRGEGLAAARIQAAWRGYVTRRESVPQLVQIRKRSRNANRNAAPNKTLAHLRDEALKTLICDQSTLSQIISALEDLEFVTRRCKATCEKLCSILAEQVYVTICSTGRSLPEMKACLAATSILISFCKYPATTETAWCPEYMDHILTLMVNWCDKESLLFSYFCTLLWLFAHREHCRVYILSIPNVKRRIDRISALVTRKRNMVARARKEGDSLFKNCSGLPMPSLKPDWGLDFKDNPRTFTNAVQAFHGLVKILGIH